MAATKSHRFLGGSGRVNDEASGDNQFEFDEADVWSTDDVIFLPQREHVTYERRKRHLRKSVIQTDHHLPAVGAKSLPVNIPDWSKILGGEYRIRGGDHEYEEEDDVEIDRIAPHEYLARTRVDSLSVHEGVGRTLKGRDLSRVRNAIWKKTGFED